MKAFEIDLNNLGKMRVTDNRSTLAEGEYYEAYIVVQTGKRAGDTARLLTTRGDRAREIANFILAKLEAK